MYKDPLPFGSNMKTMQSAPGKRGMRAKSQVLESTTRRHPRICPLSVRERTHYPSPWREGLVRLEVRKHTLLQQHPRLMTLMLGHWTWKWKERWTISWPRKTQKRHSIAKLKSGWDYRDGKCHLVSIYKDPSPFGSNMKTMQSASVETNTLQKCSMQRGLREIEKRRCTKFRSMLSNNFEMILEIT